jgi:hypothetical protein
MRQFILMARATACDEQVVVRGSHSTPQQLCTHLPTSSAAAGGSADRLGWCSIGMMSACCGLMGPLSRARYTSSPTLDTKSTST